MRYGLVLDLTRCLGCHACSLACKVENATGPGVFWSRVSQFEEGQYPEVRRAYIPRLCMHCDRPACVTVCPTKATFKDPRGFVPVDEDKCIGCGACVLACPYQARYLNPGQSYFSEFQAPWGEACTGHRQGTAGKCTFCAHLVLEGLQPACVEACPTRARIFGDLDDPQSEVALIIAREEVFQMEAELNQDPSVYYLPPRSYRFRGRSR